MLSYLTTYFEELIKLTSEMAPYLLLGFLFAGLLHVYFRKDRVVKYLGKSNLKSVLYAALLGVPLPLCSCGVIPTGVSFYRSGSSKGAAVSFLISTPQTGVDSILVTYSLIGLPFALIRPVVALLSGVFGGWLTNLVEKSSPEITHVESKNHEAPIHKEHKLLSMFRYAFVEFLQDISTYLLFGLLLAALIAVLIPADFFTQYIGNPFVEMILVLIASVPLYICATGSVPIAAVLLMKGISPGAALVLLMAGPATNVATITVIGKTMGKRTLVTYLVSIIAGAMLFGMLINLLFPTDFLISGLNQMGHDHGNHLLLEWFNGLSAVLLALLIANGYFVRYKIYRKVFPVFYKNRESEIVTNGFDMNKIEIIVKGMTCNHCKANVENGISQLDGVKSVQADISSQHVTIEADDINLEAIAQKVNDLGYEFKGKA
ncbi:permease [Bacteroidota bacterium]